MLFAGDLEAELCGVSRKRVLVSLWAHFFVFSISLGLVPLAPFQPHLLLRTSCLLMSTHNDRLDELPIRVVCSARVDGLRRAHDNVELALDGQLFYLAHEGRLAHPRGALEHGDWLCLDVFQRIFQNCHFRSASDDDGVLIFDLGAGFVLLTLLGLIGVEESLLSLDRDLGRLLVLDIPHRLVDDVLAHEARPVFCFAC